MTPIDIMTLAGNSVAIGLAIWIMQLGQKQMTQMYSDYKTSMEAVIKHQQEQNKMLHDTLISCISAINNGKPCP